MNYENIGPLDKIVGASSPVNHLLIKEYFGHVMKKRKEKKKLFKTLLFFQMILYRGEKSSNLNK